MNKAAALITIIIVIVLQSPQIAAQIPQNILSFTFINTINSTPLMLDSGNYINQFNENYSISKLKYYISNVQLHTNNQYVFKEANSYHLIDESDTGSKSFSIMPLSNTYTSLSFIIGVDSFKNVSGAQTGALDPLNGMFWTWNTGYVMFKLEGRSPQSHLANNKIEYHIGGFKSPNSVLRVVELKIPSSYQIIKKNSNASIIIGLDIGQLWNADHNFKIAQTPACTVPGELSSNIADNYSKLFRILEITNTTR